MSKIDSFENLRDLVSERLKDEEDAIHYINSAIEDYAETKDFEGFLLAINDVVIARGGIAKLAEATHLNRPGLYRSLSRSGNPKLETLLTILHELGMKISVSAA